MDTRPRRRSLALVLLPLLAFAGCVTAAVRPITDEYGSYEDSSGEEHPGRLHRDLRRAARYCATARAAASDRAAARTLQPIATVLVVLGGLAVSVGGAGYGIARADAPTSGTASDVTGAIALGGSLFTAGGSALLAWANGEVTAAREASSATYSAELVALQLRFGTEPNAPAPADSANPAITVADQCYSIWAAREEGQDERTRELINSLGEAARAAREQTQEAREGEQEARTAETEARARADAARQEAEQLEARVATARGEALTQLETLRTELQRLTVAARPRPGAPGQPEAAVRAAEGATAAIQALPSDGPAPPATPTTPEQRPTTSSH